MILPIAQKCNWFIVKFVQCVGGGSFQWGHDLIIGEAHLLNHAPKGRNRLFLGMLSGDTCVSIPDFLLLCLVIGLVTVHTCELIKVSLSRPTAWGRLLGM